ELFRRQHAAVQPAQADRPAAVVLQELHEVFIDLARKDHLHNIDGLLVRHAHPTDKLALHADLFQHGADLRPAAMHQHHIDAHELHQDNIAHHGVLQIVVNHGVAAVFDHYGLSRIFLDVWQRLYKHLGPL